MVWIERGRRCHGRSSVAVAAAAARIAAWITMPDPSPRERGGAARSRSSSDTPTKAPNKRKKPSRLKGRLDAECGGSPPTGLPTLTVVADQLSLGIGGRVCAGGGAQPP